MNFIFVLSLSKMSIKFKKIYLLLPLALPLILYLILEGLFALYPEAFLLPESVLSYEVPIIIISSIGLFFLVHFFMPVILVKIWRCQPLEGPIRNRLEALCKRAHFRCRDIKTWGIIDNTLTAAVIGIYPRFRYVLFTKRLIHQMKPECLEAILCHEIGHSYHKHLWIFPFIFGGMGFCAVAVSYLVTYAFDNPYFYYFAIFVSFLATSFLYVRVVYGFYSRLFERQADLHIFVVGLNPVYLIEALSYFAAATGQDPCAPDWHHYSIQERIDFIMKASVDRNLIARHHRYVQTMVYIYLVCFFILGCLAIGV